MTKILRPYTIVPRDLYVLREADRQLENAILDMGRPPYILVARQMGKTNLLINAKRNLPVGDDIFVYIDMSNIFSSARECFRNITERIIETSEGTLEYLIAEIAKVRALNLSAHTEHGRELRLCLRAITGKIVIILDEIDALTKSLFSDEIFSQVRSIYFERVSFLEYERLTYVLSGVAEPGEIIKNAKVSPFNIGQKIFLNDFSRTEMDQFLEKSKIDISDEISSHLYNWTAGNPRMTWEICSSLEDRLSQLEIVSTSLIDQIVQELYLTSFDRPPVDHIRDLVTNDVAIRNAIIEIKYNKGDEVSDANRRKLYLSGIINSSSLSGNAVLKNKIIESSLNDKWLQEITKQSIDYLSLGNSEFEQVRYAEAVVNYQSFLANNPSNIPEIFNYRYAVCCFRTNNYLDSIKYFDFFEVSKTQHVAIYKQKMHMKGMSYAYLNMYPEAKSAFLEVVISKIKNYEFFDSNLSLIFLETVMNEKPHWLELKNATSKYLTDYNRYRDNLSGSQFTELNVSTHIMIANLAQELNNTVEAQSHLEKALEIATINTHPKILFMIYEMDRTEQNISRIIDVIKDKQLRPFQFDPYYPHVFTTNLLYKIIIEAHKTSLFEYKRIADYVISEIFADGFNDQTFAFYIANYINQYLRSEKPTAVKMLEEIVSQNFQELDSDFQFKVIRQLAFCYQKVTDYDRTYIKEIKSNPALINLNIQDVMIFSKNISSLIDSRLSNRALELVDLGLSFSESIEREKEFDLTIFYYYRMIIFDQMKKHPQAIDAASQLLSMMGNQANSTNLLSEREFSHIQSEALEVLKRVPVVKSQKISRNDKVTVRYQNGITIQGKYKKFEVDILAGRCIVTERF